MKLSSRKIRKKSAVFLAAGCWATTLAIIAAALFSYVLPQDLTKTTRLYATLVAVSFFGRVLTFQMSLALGFFAVIAGMFRRRWLLVIAGIGSLAMLSPTLISLWPHAPPTSVGPTLRLMSMNLKYTHRDGDLIVGQIQKYNPDVLVLEDYTPFAQTVLDKAFVDDYPHRYLLSIGCRDWRSIRAFHLTAVVRARPSPKPAEQMRAVVTFDGHPVVIYIEHPFSPRSRQRILNNRISTVDLANQVRAEKLPVIVAGDFNFTTETPNEAELKSTGVAGHI